MPKVRSAVLFSLLLLLAAFSGRAQKGTIRGTVIEDGTGEPLFSANVVLRGTQVGTTADFDGNFELKALPGTYDVQVSFIGLSQTTITGVEVRADEVTLIDVIRLEPASNELSEVTITAEAARNTEAALLTVKKKSVSVFDGISSAKLRKTGDSDAGDAAKRVTGVSVEGGKYVYVRGLGDRYTKTMLNGVDVPGLDPDRNAIQIDIFPTSLISNMTVLKNGDPSLPADYTGGVVNIETKSFPETRVFSLSAGVGYNPSMHFNPNYLAYEGSFTDFLGFDGGARQLPNGASESPMPRPGSSPDAEVGELVNSFSPTLGAMEQSSFMDFDLGVSFGDQKAFENGHKIGYIFNLNYKNSTNYYDQVTYGEYVRSINPSEYNNLLATEQVGREGERNVLMGGLAGVAYKTLQSKYRLTLMHLQNGESSASRFDVDNIDGVAGQSGYRARTTNLTYSQRGLTNLLLEGKHHDEEDKWDIEWKVSPTFSNIVEPDLRRTPFTIERGDRVFNSGQGGFQNRIWRYLDEVNLVEKVDFNLNLKTFGRDSKLKFGVSHLYKQRDYEILSFDLVPNTNDSTYTYDGDPNNVLTDIRTYPEGVLYYRSNNSPNGEPNPNAYSSNANNFGGYGAFEFSPLLKLKAILGLRVEYYLQRHTGRDQDGAINPARGNVLDNNIVLNALDLFPSLNLIYSLTDDQNLRFNYFRSIARPSFKELSFAEILDPVTNRTFIGGLTEYKDPSTGESIWDGNLTSARVNNLDVRYEIFSELGGLISFSGFAKYFDDAIELVRIPEALTSPNFQPRNVGDGRVYGVEVEIRRSLNIIAPSLKDVSFSGNVTLVHSQIQMTGVEFEARKAYEKEGQTIEDTRAMAGQAPYIVNAGLQYDNPDRKFGLGAYYNVKGPTLEVVGSNLFPDVYTQPFHSLNLSGSKSFGKTANNTISLKVKNVLMDARESFYVGYRGGNDETDYNEIFSQWYPGLEISLSYSYSF